MAADAIALDLGRYFTPEAAHVDLVPSMDISMNSLNSNLETNQVGLG